MVDPRESEILTPPGFDLQHIFDCKIIGHKSYRKLHEHARKYFLVAESTLRIESRWGRNFGFTDGPPYYPMMHNDHQKFNDDDDVAPRSGARYI